MKLTSDLKCITATEINIFNSQQTILHHFHEKKKKKNLWGPHAYELLITWPTTEKLLMPPPQNNDIYICKNEWNLIL
jgi:hypothetical protein